MSQPHCSSVESPEFEAFAPKAAEPKGFALTGWVALTVIFWASAFPAITVALREFKPFELAFIRFAATGVFLAITAAVIGIRRPALADLPKFIAAGLLGVTGYHGALNYGQLTVSPGAASLIVNITPLLTTIFASIFLREEFRARTVAGLLLSLSGVAVIAMAENRSFGLNHGALFVLLAALFQSSYFMIQKPLLNRYSAFEVVSYTVWFGSAASLFFAHDVASQFVMSSNGAKFCLLYLAIFPGLLSFVAWSKVIAQMPASRASSYLYLVPVIAIAVSWAWLGQAPRIFTVVGGALALSGVFVVNGLSGSKRARS